TGSAPGGICGTTGAGGRPAPHQSGQPRPGWKRGGSCRSPQGCSGRGTQCPGSGAGTLPAERYRSALRWGGLCAPVLPAGSAHADVNNAWGFSLNIKKLPPFTHTAASAVVGTLIVLNQLVLCQHFVEIPCVFLQFIRNKRKISGPDPPFLRHVCPVARQKM